MATAASSTQSMSQDHHRAYVLFSGSQCANPGSCLGPGLLTPHCHNGLYLCELLQTSDKVTTIMWFTNKDYPRHQAQATQQQGDLGTCRMPAWPAPSAGYGFAFLCKLCKQWLQNTPLAVPSEDPSCHWQTVFSGI